MNEPSQRLAGAAASPSSAPRPLRAGFVGRLDYGRSTQLQAELRDDLQAGHGDEHLLLLEHPHVFTLGRNASRTDVLATRAWLEHTGAEIHECDRGGQVTYHGPGQLVGYPILDLNPNRRDIRRYVCDLQETLIRTLADFGVPAQPGLPDRPAGVWVEERKIGSIGVHLRRWITSHGFALNVSTDLSYFDAIVPCGMPDVQMTSVARETGQAAEVAAVSDRCLHHFCAVFGRRAVPLQLAPEKVTRAAPTVAEAP